MLGMALAGCKSVETTSAILHNDAGRHDLAIETSLEALAKNPNDAEAYFQLGIAYSQLDSVGLAYTNFMRAGEIDPKRDEMINNNIQSNFAKHYNLALNLWNEADKSLAAHEFKLSTEADPRQAKGYYMLGRCYVVMADDDPNYYNKAIDALDTVLELSGPADKHYVDALSLAGEALAAAGRPEEAISRFSRLVEEDPTNYQVIEKIGYNLLDSEDWNGSAVFLSLAADARSRIDADDFNLYYNIGVAYYQMRKDDPAMLDKAIENYEMALNLQPDEPTTTFNIIVVYIAKGDWTQAQAWGEKYIGQNPDDPDGWRVLSRIYTEMGDQEKARRCLDRHAELIKAQQGN
jgi:superkiller protein 3